MPYATRLRMFGILLSLASCGPAETPVTPAENRPGARDNIELAIRNATANLPSTPAGIEAEERLAVKRLSELLPAEQFDALTAILDHPDRYGIPLGVPNDIEATALVHRVNALRDAAHGQRQLAAMRSAARTFTSPLRIVALDKRRLGRGARLVARLVRSPRGGNTLILGAGEVTADVIARGLRMLDLSRLEQGEIPAETITIHIKRGVPMSPEANAKRNLAADLVTRLSSAQRASHAGIGTGRTLDVLIEPISR